MGRVALVGRWMLCCIALLLVFCFVQDGMAKTKKKDLMIRTFDDLYEPSAVVFVGGGEFLIFEDDGKEMVSRYHLGEDGSGVLLNRHKYPGALGLSVTDIEGATKGSKDTVFIITSHSLNREGERRSKRELLLRVHPKERTGTEILGSAGLWDGLIGELLKVDSSLENRTKKLNVEGISFTRGGQVLMIGLRAPVYKGDAIIVLLENPYGVGGHGSEPQFLRKPILLDLGGAGIRAMTYDESSGYYFLVSEVRGKKGKMRPRLWSWDGGRTHDPIRMKFSGLKKLKNIEGLTFFRDGGKNLLLLVCDDGDKKKRQRAHYAIVEANILRPKNN